MKIIIERAKPSEAAQLLSFLKAVGSETDNLSFGEEGLPFSIEAEEAFLADLEHSADGIMLTAKVDGVIVGDASLMRQPRRMGHRGEFGISVLRQHWGQGVGSRLRANGFAVIDLQVRSDNERAIGLYRKFGFEKLCTHPDFHRVNGQPVAYDLMFLKL